MAHHRIDMSKENVRLGELGGKIAVPALIIGIVGVVVSVAIGFVSGDDMQSRAFESYLINFMFFLAIALGAMFLTVIHHLTRAGWSSSIRRLAEAIAANMWILAILFLPLVYALLSDHIHLFPWAKESMSHDALVQHKAGYLNVPFFLIRAAVYFGIWILISQYFFRLSVKQDETGDIELSHRMQARSAPAIPLFALTLSFAAFDWLMSQDPHYFSTIWGVYYFAGCVTSFLSTAILLFAGLQKTGRVERAVHTEHFHDMGKLLFAFGMVFWAYIAFSQYMLQWYANIPEETAWWQARGSTLDGVVESHVTHSEYKTGWWNAWTVFLLLGHFAVPFVAVISRWTKRILPLLCIAAAWMLFMCWVDVFWLIMPVFYPDGGETVVSPLAITDLLGFVGMGALLLGATAWRLRNVNLVATADPRLDEALAFENA